MGKLCRIHLLCNGEVNLIFKAFKTMFQNNAGLVLEEEKLAITSELA